MSANRPHQALNLTRSSLASVCLVLLGAAGSVASCAIPKLEIDPQLGQGGSQGVSTTGTAKVKATNTAEGGASESSDPTNTTTHGTGSTNGVGGTQGAGGARSTSNAATSGGKSTGGASNHTGAGGTGGRNTSAVIGTAGATTVPLATAGAAGAMSGSCLGRPLPMVRGGLLSNSNNDCGIVSNWYWFKDTPSTTNPLETKVSVPASASIAPIVEGGGKACIKGTTVTDPKFGAWGAGIGFDFNYSDGARHAYDADSRGIGGFEVTISGSFPQGLRINFNPAVQAADQPAPFVPIARAGTYRIRFADAFVPSSWTNVANAGAPANSKELGTFQVQVVGGTTGGDFDFCVESVIPLPIQDDGALGNKPVKFVSIPLTEALWVAAKDNIAEIQGSYYCYGAKGSGFTCGTAGTTTPYRPDRGSSGAMCVSGSMTTSVDNWGAGVGLNLNQTSSSAARQPYNATAHKLRGFRIQTEQKPALQPLRVQMASVSTFAANEVLPMTEFAAPGQHVVEIGSLGCPNWTDTTCTNLAPNSVYMLEVQMASQQLSVAYDLCVTKIEAMVER